MSVNENLMCLETDIERLIPVVAELTVAVKALTAAIKAQQRAEKKAKTPQ